MKIQEIIKRGLVLLERVNAQGYVATERDVAESQELVHSYIDELERLENNITIKPVTDIDAIAESILQRWYP